MNARQRAIMQAVRELELSKGCITPRDLWESARAESHPLHGEFEWDDTIAAAAHRDEQARRLLRIEVVLKVEEREIRAPICVHSPDAAPGEASYVRTLRVMTDRDRSRKVLAEELDRASAAVQRARVVAEALGLGSKCQKILELIVHTRNAADAAAE